MLSWFRLWRPVVNLCLLLLTAIYFFVLATALGFIWHAPIQLWAITQRPSARFVHWLRFPPGTKRSTRYTTPPMSDVNVRHSHFTPVGYLNTSVHCSCVVFQARLSVAIEMEMIGSPWAEIEYELLQLHQFKPSKADALYMLGM